MNDNDTLETHTSLGGLIVALYDEYLALYGDRDLASVAAAATLNTLIVESVALDDAGAPDATSSDAARAA
jgi:hypothetical protein